MTCVTFDDVSRHVQPDFVREKGDRVRGADRKHNSHNPMLIVRGERVFRRFVHYLVPYRPKDGPASRRLG